MSLRNRITVVVSIACLTGLVLVTLQHVQGDQADSAKSAKIPLFESEIQPLLKERCVRCHGGRDTKAGLDLTSLATIYKGGESGRVLVPGNVAESVLYELVHEGAMPPSKRDNLSEAEVALIHRWIEAGAPSKKKVVNPYPEVTQHDILPIMRLRCTVCHGIRETAGGLDLRSKAAMLEGGKSGPALVLNHPEKSLLLKKIHEGKMPPRDRLIKASVKPMPKDEIELVTRWIELGAPEVDIKPDVAGFDGDPLVADEDREFWAFQPPKQASVPKVKSTKRVRTPIDAFVLRKLEANGLIMSPEADKLTLLRRAHLDLIGLPPTAEQVKAFLDDNSPDAYEKLIDRLLASPHYGERWGRYWLDLAGYADSEGKRSADPIRPHAWRYRDYVIRSFNEDKPYDRFLIEQLAGDELVDYTHADEITPEIMRNLVATGFLRMTPDGTGSDVVNLVENRLEVIGDEMQVLSGGIMGMTMHCARCHSHKYDPIPQRDYYRLLAVFKGAYDEYDWLKPTSVPGQSRAGNRKSRLLSFLTEDAKNEWKAYQKKVEAEMDRLNKDKSSVAKAQARALKTVAGTEPAIRALWDRGQPSPAYIYRRGDHLQPAKLVGPGVPSVLTNGKTPFVYEPPFPDAPSTGARLAFANWLTQPKHPLTARVMINRIWKHHFGTGIVKTLDNFGTTGAPPTHPELLDWLAVEFVNQGWSMKAMHKLIMTSSVYRQSSTVDAQMEKLDPANQLLSRMPMQRMDAEVLYDSMLFVSGQFDSTSYGPPDGVIGREDGLVMAMPSEKGYRRSIYVRQRRSQVPTLLQTFDMPQMNPNCVDRPVSTVATQALYLKNNAMVWNLAEKFADRAEKVAAENRSQQVEWIYLSAMNRFPTAKEREVSLQALDQLTQHWAKEMQTDDLRPQSAAGQKALTSYCHTILNSGAFLYID